LLEYIKQNRITILLKTFQLTNKIKEITQYRVGVSVSAIVVNCGHFRGPPT